MPSNDDGIAGENQEINSNNLLNFREFKNDNPIIVPKVAISEEIIR